MSVKITVEIPLEDVVNIQADPLDSNLFQQSANTVNSAALQAIRHLPYRVTPTNIATLAKALSGAGHGITITVNTITNKNHKFVVPLKTTIGQLRELLHCVTGIPPEQQRLAFHGQPLGGLVEDDTSSHEAKTLESCGVQEGSQIFLSHY